MSCHKSLPLRMCESDSKLGSQNLLCRIDLLLVFHFHFLLRLLVDIHHILGWGRPGEQQLVLNISLCLKYLLKSVGRE